MSRVCSLCRLSPVFLGLLASTLALAGCSGATGSENGAVSRQAAPVAPSPAMTSDERTESAPLAPDDLVVLRQATLPTDDPQPFRVRLSDRRETTGEGFEPTVQELTLDLTGTLVSQPAGKGERGAVVRFERIVLTYTSPGSEPHTLAYDSAAKVTGRPDALREAMSVVAGAEARISLTPGGRLAELNGLDVLWRKADKLLIPPGLQAVQWLFRDVGMGELLGEALFPPMPENSVGVCEHWGESLPANLLFTAPLQARLDATLVGLDRSNAERPVARLRLAGDIVPDTRVEGAEQPGLLPQVVSGRQEIDLAVQPSARSLSQTSLRRLDLRLTLQPPQGESRRLRIEQTRRLQVERGKPISAPR